MSTPRAVLLDVGGVLVVPHPDAVAPALLPFGVDVDEAAAVVAHYAGVAGFDASDTPEDWVAYLLAYTASLGVSPERVEVVARALVDVFGGPAPPLWRHVLDGVPAGLATLASVVRGQGAALGVVSNADGTVAALLADLGLCQVGPGAGVELDVLVDSGAVGVSKPDPAIFGFALDPLGLDPADVVYIGDTVRNDVEGARAAGIEAWHVDPLGRCGATDHVHVAGVVDAARRLAGGGGPVPG